MSFEPHKTKTSIHGSPLQCPPRPPLQPRFSGSLVLCRSDSCTFIPLTPQPLLLCWKCPVKLQLTLCYSSWPPGRFRKNTQTHADCPHFRFTTVFFKRALMCTAAPHCRVYSLSCSPSKSFQTPSFSPTFHNSHHHLSPLLPLSPRCYLFPVTHHGLHPSHLNNPLATQEHLLQQLPVISLQCISFLLYSIIVISIQSCRNFPCLKNILF